MAFDCCGGKRSHLPGCPSGEAEQPKRRLPRGAKCPECRAVMHMNSKGQMECSFAGSHAAIKRNRAASATAQGEARRGTEAAKNQERVDLRALRKQQKDAGKQRRKDR